MEGLNASLIISILCSLRIYKLIIFSKKFKHLLLKLMIRTHLMKKLSLKIRILLENLNSSCMKSLLLRIKLSLLSYRIQRKKIMGRSLLTVKKEKSRWTLKLLWWNLKGNFKTQAPFFLLFWKNWINLISRQFTNLNHQISKIGRNLI